MSERPIVIVGAGPAGLIAAWKLAKNGFKVCVYEQNKTAARKFLVAGHGGFNLTHNEDIATFVEKYDKPEIQEIVRYFDNQATISWLDSLGIPTYVGSSGKIFPKKGIKPIQVLQAILEALSKLEVTILYGYRMVSFNEQKVFMLHQEVVCEVPYQRLILATGGASWSKTGSDGQWVGAFADQKILVNPFQAANSGLETVLDFSSLAGKVLKNVTLRFEQIIKTGEVVITSYGLEGAPVYFMNRFIRNHPFPLYLYVDLKPSLSLDDIHQLLQKNGKISQTLKQVIKLSETGLSLTKLLPKETYTDAAKLADAIKNYPMQISSFRPIEEVISTAGGVAFEELSASLALRKFPDVYCIGEMLDWEAPTGGYLLQACFSAGMWVADQLIKEAK